MSNPQTNPGVADGAPVPKSAKALETASSLVQDYEPLKNVCAYLNAFHIYVDDPSRCVEAQHYCMHIADGVRQCILFDSPAANACLIGVEYMISRELYEGLDVAERRLWHSHVFEVKSGQLIMPKPSASATAAVVSDAVWDAAETKEMGEVVQLYGKTWHLWQVDRGDRLPLGRPMLMGSFVRETDGFREACADRDRRFGVDRWHKAQLRDHIASPSVHPDADHWDHSKQC